MMCILRALQNQRQPEAKIIVQSSFEKKQTKKNLKSLFKETDEQKKIGSTYPNDHHRIIDENVIESCFLLEFCQRYSIITLVNQVIEKKNSTLSRVSKNISVCKSIVSIICDKWSDWP